MAGISTWGPIKQNAGEFALEIHLQHKKYEHMLINKCNHCYIQIATKALENSDIVHKI